MEGRPVRGPPVRGVVRGFEAYARSKLLKILWTFALARRLEGSGVVANATNPGMAWTSGTEGIARRSMPALQRLFWPAFSPDSAPRVRGESRSLLGLPRELTGGGECHGDVLREQRQAHAPAAEVVRYYNDSRTAVMVGGILQALSAVSLFVFAACVAAFVRRMAVEGRALPGLTSGGGTLAAAFLLLSVLLSWVLALTAAGGELALVSTLRNLNFLAGGVAHVVSLGLFVGACSVAALRAKALPRWISRLGILAAMLSLLSLASLVWFPATFLLPSAGCSASYGALP